MSLYLGIAILLFILLFFFVREGFYSDMNITSTADNLKAFNKQLETLGATMKGFSTSTLSVTDAISSLSKTLLTKDNPMYTSGVVQRVTDIKEELDLLQMNVNLLNDTLLNLSKTVYLEQYDPKTKNRVSKSLEQTLESLTTQANRLISKLNKIPDS